MNTAIAESFSTLEWGRVDLQRVPHLPVPAPGPLSNAWHERCTKYFKGLSGQVKLFPVTFESGQGCVLRDVDGKSHALDTSANALSLAIFFRTACPTCQYAWKYFERLHSAYSDAGLRVLGISQHNAAETREFGAQYATTFPLLLDDGFAVSREYDPAVWGIYTPSWAELIIFAGSFAFFAQFILLFIKGAPFIAISEVKELAIHERAHARQGAH